MDKVYADLIEKGLRTLESIPARIRGAVAEELARRASETAADGVE